MSVSRAYAIGGGTDLTPEAVFGYRYDTSANRGGVTLIAQDGTVFTGNGLKLDPNAAMLGAGLSVRNSALTGFIRYRASLSSNWSDQSLTAGLRWSF